MTSSGHGGFFPYGFSSESISVSPLRLNGFLHAAGLICVAITFAEFIAVVLAVTLCTSPGGVVFFGFFPVWPGSPPESMTENILFSVLISGSVLASISQ